MKSDGWLDNDAATAHHRAAVDRGVRDVEEDRAGEVGTALWGCGRRVGPRKSIPRLSRFRCNHQNNGHDDASFGQAWAHFFRRTDALIGRAKITFHQSVRSISVRVAERPEAENLRGSGSGINRCARPLHPVSTSSWRRRDAQKADDSPLSEKLRGI